ncbi:RHS repeat domain-containing protein [Priestia megaterium]
MIESTYDTADRTTSEKRDGTTAFSFEYDKNGNETKVTDSVNSVVRTKAYDKAGQITSMTDRGGAFGWEYKKILPKLSNQNSLKVVLRMRTPMNTML